MTSNHALPYISAYPNRPIHIQDHEHDGIQFRVTQVPLIDEDGPIRGKILFLHGWSEHSSLYYRIMEFFTSLGYECWIYDQRGTGETSKGKYKGRSGRNKDVAYKDLDKLIEIAFDFSDSCLHHNKESLTYSLVGHSMGGTIALGYGFKGKYRNKINNIITSAPLIDYPPNLELSSIKYAILSKICDWFPYQRYQLSKSKDAVTSDPQWKEYLEAEADECNISTLSQLKFILDRAQEITELLSASQFPSSINILIFHSKDDFISSHIKSKNFFNNLKVSRKEYVTISKAKHALFMENDEVFKLVCLHIKDFMK